MRIPTYHSICFTPQTNLITLPAAHAVPSTFLQNTYSHPHAPLSRHPGKQSDWASTLCLKSLLALPLRPVTPSNISLPLSALVAPSPPVIESVLLPARRPPPASLSPFGAPQEHAMLTRGTTGAARTTSVPNPQPPFPALKRWRWQQQLNHGHWVSSATELARVTFPSAEGPAAAANLYSGRRAEVAAPFLAWRRVAHTSTSKRVANTAAVSATVCNASVTRKTEKLEIVTADYKAGPKKLALSEVVLNIRTQRKRRCLHRWLLAAAQRLTLPGDERVTETSSLSCPAFARCQGGGATTQRRVIAHNHCRLAAALNACSAKHHFSAAPSAGRDPITLMIMSGPACIDPRSNGSMNERERLFARPRGYRN